MNGDDDDVFRPLEMLDAGRVWLAKMEYYVVASSDII